MFNPSLNTRLVIDEQEYKFSPHPVVPTLVWGQEGRHAIVYRMEPVGEPVRALSRANGHAVALKVFRPAFRHPGLLESAEALSWAHELPGMRVCDQKVIRRETHPQLVGQYEDLDYAMLMPWIEGQTWFDYLQKRERTTLDQSRALAESMVWTLYALEINKLAHCDLSSGNVIVDPSLQSVHLVDVEDLYSPWLTPPPMVPAGTPGYQHREVSKVGQWRSTGDRFAGAVLMAEMLGWAHPEVRENAFGESYFAPDELQKDTPRYHLLQEVIRVYDEGFADVFADAWKSDSLDECPPFEEWYDLVDDLPYGPVASWAPVNPQEFDVETAVPDNIAVPAQPVRVSTPAASAPGPGQPAATNPQAQRSGCRLIFVIIGVALLLLCYATFVAIEWSLLQGAFTP